MNRFDVFRPGTPGNLQHSIQLVQSRRAWEEGLSSDELCKYAAHAPHINTLCVLVRAEEDLRRAVPPSSYIVS